MPVHPQPALALASLLLLQANVAVAQAASHAGGASALHRSPPTRVLPQISSGFGDRRDPLAGSVRLHAGIDIPAPLGTAVHSAAPGRVRFTGAAGSYGLMVEIDHGDGLHTRYGHLSQILVVPGQAVADGQAIARVGSTGRSTGNHLHFEVRRDGLALDPIPFLTGSVPPAAIAAAPLTSSEPHLSAFARARNHASHPDGEGP